MPSPVTPIVLKTFEVRDANHEGKVRQTFEAERFTCADGMFQFWARKNDSNYAELTGVLYPMDGWYVIEKAA